MSGASGGKDAEADVARRVRNVGTGASGERGTLGNGTETGGGGKDAERRIRHMGTGGHEDTGDVPP